MTRTRRAAGAGPLLPALAVVSLLLAGCAAAGAGASQEPVATTTVDLPKSYRFAPAAISVPVGTTVTWTNNDNFTHNVAFDGAAPLTMAPGQQATFTFATAGTFPYVCSLHPSDMTGSVVVTGS